MRKGMTLAALCVALSLLASVVGCGQAPAQKVSLKVGVLPIVDALPLYVAQQEGYFQQENVDVEITLFQSALERDSALQAGQIDGVLADLVSACLLNKDGDRVRVVRLAYRGTPARAMMTILVSPQSKARSVADLKGGTIAISKNTVIEYSTDRMLKAAGLSASDVSKTEVTKIPVRVEMLIKGQVDAATLPEPFASLSVKQGARVVADDSKSGIGQSVLTFRKDLTQGNAEAVKRLLRAYERATESINGSPEKYHSLMAEKGKVPELLRDSFAVPLYPKGQVPSQDEVQAVVSWMLELRLLEKPLRYDEVVTSSLLPEAR